MVFPSNDFKCHWMYLNIALYHIICSRLTIQPNGPNKAENHVFQYNHNPRLPPHKVSVYTFYVSMLLH